MTKRMKKTVKAWAVVNDRGELRAVRIVKESALGHIRECCGKKIVRCEILYEI